MKCTQCGLDQVPGAQFCRQCGAHMPVVMGYSPQAFLPQDRVRQNMQPLGIMWILFGGYRIVSMLIATVALHTMVNSGMLGDAPWFVTHLMRTLLPVVGVIIIAMGLAAIATGYALLTRQPWARVAAIVLGILALIKIPFGTALGIYTLWVLAPRTSGIEWETIAPTRTSIAI